MRLATLLLPLVLFGCSSGRSHGFASFPAPGEATTGGSVFAPDSDRERGASSEYLNVAPDSVWRLLPLVYARLGMEGRVLDSASRVYGVQNATVEKRLGESRISELIDCGATPLGAPAAESNRLVLSVTTRIPRGSAGTEVRTLVAATTAPSGPGGTPVRCVSTGRLEQRLADLLRAELSP